MTFPFQNQLPKRSYSMTTFLGRGFGPHIATSGGAVIHRGPIGNRGTPAPLRVAAGIPRWNGGFTLVEIVLAMAVVTIGIVSVVSLIGVGLQQNREAQNEAMASLLARDYFSKLNAAYAWTPDGVQNSELVNLLGAGQSLETFAQTGAVPVVRATSFDSDRRVVPANDPNALLVLTSEIGPAAFALNNASLQPLGLQASALASIETATNMIWARFTISFPKTPSRNHQFITLITRPPPQ